MESSDLYVIIAGLFLIGFGFLVKIFPILIAGYNTMTKEQKEKVDIKKVSSILRNGLIIIGLVYVLSYFFFKWVGLDGINDYSRPLIMIIGVILIIKYSNQNCKK